MAMVPTLGVVPLHTRVVAAALIVIVLISTNAGLHSGDDDACDQPLAAQRADAGARVASPPAATPEPAHCAICHWLQTFRAGSISHLLLQGSAPSCTSSDSTAPARVVAADRFTLPLRAPPA
jgi:hypothetical protein